MIQNITDVGSANSIAARVGLRGFGERSVLRFPHSNHTGRATHRIWAAGIPLNQVAGSNTSVFAGLFIHDYHDSIARDVDNLPRFLPTGTGSAMAANRISHFFDLRGASMSIDTGCSTTLVALHQAIQSLRAGEVDMSIVGGSNVMLNPDMFKTMSSLGYAFT